MASRQLPEVGKRRRSTGRNTDLNKHARRAAGRNFPGTEIFTADSGGLSASVQTEVLVRTARSFVCVNKPIFQRPWVEFFAHKASTSGQIKEAFLNKEQIKHWCEVLKEVATGQLLFFGGKNLYLYSKSNDFDWAILGLSGVLYLTLHAIIHRTSQGNLRLESREELHQHEVLDIITV